MPSHAFHAAGWLVWFGEVVECFSSATCHFLNFLVSFLNCVCPQHGIVCNYYYYYHVCVLFLVVPLFDLFFFLCIGVGEVLF